MDLDPRFTAAIIAGVVSVVVGVISYLSNRSAVRHEMQKAQFKNIIAKRVELYPKLWRIHIRYETNWVLEGRPKSREWAEEYVSKLNEFNLEGECFSRRAYTGSSSNCRLSSTRQFKKRNQGSRCPMRKRMPSGMRFTVRAGLRVWRPRRTI